MHIHSKDINSDCGLWFQNYGPALAGSAGPIQPPLCSISCNVVIAF